MGFESSKSEPDIWMRKNGNVYEYMAAVYVDNLAIAAKDPKGITDILMDKHEFKLKGTGPITYHLGWDFFRNSTGGVMCMAPNKYIDKMISMYGQMFGCKPCTRVSSPLEKVIIPKSAHLSYSTKGCPTVGINRSSVQCNGLCLSDALILLLPS
jgi:hypothetical protein